MTLCMWRVKYYNALKYYLLAMKPLEVSFRKLL